MTPPTQLKPDTPFSPLTENTSTLSSPPTPVLQTPDKRDAMASKRQFDGLVRTWRRLLHKYDAPTEEAAAEVAAAEVAAAEAATATVERAEKGAGNKKKSRKEGKEGKAVATVAGMSLEAIAGLETPARNDMWGSQIYPVVVGLRGAELAGKITGMMLELDNAELMEIMTTDGTLKVRGKGEREGWTGRGGAGERGSGVR